MPMLIDAPIYQPQALRDYQREAVDAVKAAWSMGEPAPLVAVATGGGKTTIIAQTLVETVDPLYQRALVIAHTEEIIQQINDRVANQFGGQLDEHFGVNAAPGIGIVMADNDAADARIVVATRQSLHPKRLAKLLTYGVIDVLVIDEAHHAFIDNTYGDILKALRAANPDLKVVGVTATPARGNEQALGSVFSSIAYEWLIPDGISTGYLVPVTRIKVKTSVNAEKVRTARGDYAQGQLVSVLEAASWLDLCAQAFHEHIARADRLCLSFLPSVEMSRQFAERLKADGIAAAHLDGDTPKDERRKLLSAYKRGDLRVVSNMSVLTEGFDAPETGAIFLARPTKSQTLFTQIVGRGLRPFPGKHDCLLVDMTVTDTRALGVGRLIGRMITCRKCKTEYFFGMKACPTCGYTPERKGGSAGGETAYDQFMGGHLIANFEALFEKAFAAWYTGNDGFLSCTLSFDDGAYLIIPPLEDEYYRLAHVPKDRKHAVRFVDKNEDLASLMMSADSHIRKYVGRTADKEAAWRDLPATLAQVTLLGQLGVKADANLSKGMAQQLITHKLAVKRFLRDSGVK